MDAALELLEIGPPSGARSFSLGDRPGAYRAVATARDLQGSPLSFTATAVGPQLALVTQPSATAAAGVPLAQQPEPSALAAEVASSGTRDSSGNVEKRQGDEAKCVTTTARSARPNENSLPRQKAFEQVDGRFFRPVGGDEVAAPQPDVCCSGG